MYFSLGYTQNTGDVTYETLNEHYLPRPKTFAFLPGDEKLNGETSLIYPAFYPQQNKGQNVFARFNPDGLFNDYRVPPPVNYNGLKLQEVNNIRTASIINPTPGTEEPPDMFNTQPGQPPIMDALRNYLNQRGIEINSSNLFDRRKTIMTALKRFGLYQQGDDKLPMTELINAASNRAAAAGVDINEIVPKDTAGTGGSGVTDASNLINTGGGDGTGGSRTYGSGTTGGVNPSSMDMTGGLNTNVVDATTGGSASATAGGMVSPGKRRRRASAGDAATATMGGIVSPGNNGETKTSEGPEPTPAPEPGPVGSGEEKAVTRLTSLIENPNISAMKKETYYLKLEKMANAKGYTIYKEDGKVKTLNSIKQAAYGHGAKPKWFEKMMSGEVDKPDWRKKVENQLEKIKVTI